MILLLYCMPYPFFFFNDTATTEIYTLSLHDALPIYLRVGDLLVGMRGGVDRARARSENRRELHALPIPRPAVATRADRKSTRLNSSHANISYAVFCLKKKTEKRILEDAETGIQLRQA